MACGFPGKVELLGSKALLLGYGAIGKLIDERLRAFGTDVTIVRRSSQPGCLGPEEWRSHLGAFDWIILAVPATAETDGMIGAAELAAMKSSARIINIARGSVIDQDALVAALQTGQIAEAFLDVTTPEPLPADDVLWGLPNAHVTMHLSGRAQDKMFVRSAQRFLENLARFRAGNRSFRWSTSTWDIDHDAKANVENMAPGGLVWRRKRHRQAFA